MEIPVHVLPIGRRALARAWTRGLERLTLFDTFRETFSQATSSPTIGYLREHLEVAVGPKICMIPMRKPEVHTPSFRMPRMETNPSDAD